MLTINEDLRAEDAAAVRASVTAVEGVTAGDLRRPTPCAGWDLGELLEHMTGQHEIFAAAARGAGPSAGGGGAAAGDGVMWRYVEAAEDVIAAFAEVESLERTFHLPEVGGEVPARLAIGFHLVDYVVHGWDVARTLGLDLRCDDGVLARTLAIVRAVPDGPERREPHSPFAPALPVPPGADPLTEILLRLGRRP